jgi:hypothetical protein
VAQNFIGALMQPNLYQTIDSNDWEKKECVTQLQL